MITINNKKLETVEINILYINLKKINNMNISIIKREVPFKITP